MAENLEANQMVWHPIEQLLPNYGVRVLITWRGASQESIVIGMRYMTDQDGHHWRDDSGKELDDFKTPIAWMSFPEIYRV